MGILFDIWKQSDAEDAEKKKDGGVAVCKCPNCGHTEKHDRGTACTELKCPECGETLTGDCDRTNSVIEESVIVPYNRFNERGLNVFSKFFARKGLKVKDIRADDKVRKKDGMPTKKAVFTFENGQTLEIVLAFETKGSKQPIEKAMGAIFLAKVDNKKVPVSAASAKEAHTVKALNKIVDFLAKSAPKKETDEAERKKLLQASSAELKKTDVKAPTSTAGKLKEALARNTELKTLLQLSREKMKNEKSDNVALNKKYKSLEAKLNDLNAKEENLRHEYATLQAA